MPRKPPETRRKSGIWDSLGISRKMGFSSLLLVTLISLTTAVSLVSLYLVREAAQNILDSQEISQKIFDMDGERERARRLYQSFLLSFPEIGFEKAQELYGQPALATAARAIASNEELKRLLAQSTVSKALWTRNIDINLYLTLSRRFADVLLTHMTLTTALANPQDGLLAGLDSRMEALEALLKSTPLHALLREADLYARQYNVYRQRPYMQSAFNIISRLRGKLIEASPLDKERTARVHELLDEYVALADKILDVREAIRSATNDFALQEKTVDPISLELKNVARGEVDRATARIDAVIRIAGGIIIGATLLGLCCAIILAALLKTSVTSRIVDMTRSADLLRSGKLDVSVDTGGEDELGALAETFNDMARRVRDLVQNLEKKVRRRTRELNAKNRELDAKNQALEVLSLTDRLTGICNRRKLDQTIVAEIRRARRYGKEFSLIMIDLDHFKSVNDRHGHPVGDLVLVRVADILAGLARETDVVGRWGGEEFLVVCPETGADVAVVLAERLRKEIEETSFPRDTSLTASFGVTAATAKDDAQSLVQRADEALYAAKQNGRNRIERA